MLTVRRRRLARFSMLLVAVLALVGHVCVPPEAVAAESPATHPAPGSPAPGATDDGHGTVHGASCELVFGGGARAGAAPSVSAPLSLDAPAAPRICPLPPAPEQSAPRPSASPPLFLLHAALLI